MPPDGQKFVIFSVSDATGGLASGLAFAALRQFKEVATIVQRPRVSTTEMITRIVDEAKERQGMIVFTLVSPDLRLHLQKKAEESQVVAVDIMGPLMLEMAKYFKDSPSSEPGLQYQLTSEYLRRNEAVDFTVKHDDGLGLETLSEANIILLGISRTSKTPISIYLAFRGFKVANIPIVKGVPIPAKVWEVETKKLIGLTIAPQTLLELRKNRLEKMGKRFAESYATIESIREEATYARRLFSELGDVPLIDVTGKAIEEAATEVLLILTTPRRAADSQGE